MLVNGSEKIYKPGDVKHGDEVHFAVDLDGTLAKYVKGTFPNPPGPPISPMVRRVKKWLAAGWKVKIFTARAWLPRLATNVQISEHTIQIEMIQDWCEQHLGKRLEVTCEKTPGTLELWDDRAVSVRFNEGTYIAAGDVDQND